MPEREGRNRTIGGRFGMQCGKKEESVRRSYSPHTETSLSNSICADELSVAGVVCTEYVRTKMRSKREKKQKDRLELEQRSSPPSDFPGMAQGDWLYP